MDNIIPIRPVISPCPSWCIYRDAEPDDWDASGHRHNWCGSFGENEEDSRNPQHESQPIRVLANPGFHDAWVTMYARLENTYATVHVEGETGELYSKSALLAVADDFERAAELVRSFAERHGDDLSPEPHPLNEER